MGWGCDADVKRGAGEAGCEDGCCAGGVTGVGGVDLEDWGVLIMDGEEKGKWER